MGHLHKQAEGLFKEQHDHQLLCQTAKTPRRLANKLFCTLKKIIHDNSNDPIIISIVIHIFWVDRILVDDGSATEVLIYDAFNKMNLDESLLRSGSIYGFANQPIKVKGLINLLVTLGTGDNMVTKEA